MPVVLSFFSSLQETFDETENRHDDFDVDQDFHEGDFGRRRDLFPNDWSEGDVREHHSCDRGDSVGESEVLEVNHDAYQSQKPDGNEDADKRDDRNSVKGNLEVSILKRRSF